MKTLTTILIGTLVALISVTAAAHPTSSDTADVTSFPYPYSVASTPEEVAQPGNDSIISILEKKIAELSRKTKLQQKKLNEVVQTTKSNTANISRVEFDRKYWDGQHDELLSKQRTDINTVSKHVDKVKASTDTLFGNQQYLNKKINSVTTQGNWLWLALGVLSVIFITLLFFITKNMKSLNKDMSIVLGDYQERNPDSSNHRHQEATKKSILEKLKDFFSKIFNR